MDSIVKKAILAGLGTYTLAKEKAEALLNDLAKRGEVSEDKRVKFVRDAMVKSEERAHTLGKSVKEKREKVLAKVRPERVEIRNLSLKLDQLTEEVRKLSKAAAKS